MNRKKIRKIITLAFYLAISIILSYVESFIPLPIPGVKLGLANVITLFLLYEDNWYDALLIAICRILIVSFIRGTFLNITFFMSLGGGICAYIIMFIFSKLKFLSSITTSVLGSVFHVIGQIIIAYIITSTYAIIYYLPIIMILSIITGIISGIICILMRKRANDLLPYRKYDIENDEIG